MEGLPVGWEWRKVGDVIENIPLTGKKLPNSEYDEEGLIPVIDQGQNLIGGYTNRENLKITTDFPLIGFGDHTRILKFIDFEFVPGADGIKILKPSKEFDPKFFYYAVKASNILNLGYSRHFKILKEVIIPLPPLPVQRQIVAILEQAEAVKRQRQEADALTEALLQSVFSEMFGDPVRNEMGWNQSKLGDCCRVQRGKFTHRPRNEPRFYGGNYPFIQTGDVANCQGKLKKYTQTLNDEGLSISKMFPKGTIVISIAANIGDTAILDFDSCFPDSVVGISPDNCKGTVEFFEMMLRFYKEDLWNLAPETAQRNINLRILSELEVIIPPLALQQQFAHIVESVERIRDQQGASGRHIEGLCEGLMARAFAGELLA